jgi:hypothetical protein
MHAEFRIVGGELRIDGSIAMCRGAIGPRRDIWRWFH